MATPRFVELPLDKHAWSPSPLPGQVVLVSSRGPDGAVDVAPKSWVSMAAFAGPVVAFGCNTGHTTFRNVLATAEFVIKVPGVSLADRAWAMLESHGDERVARSRLTLGRARTVAAPVIQEAAAYTRRPRTRRSPRSSSSRTAGMRRLRGHGGSATDEPGSL